MLRRPLNSSYIGSQRGGFSSHSRASREDENSLVILCFHAPLHFLQLFSVFHANQSRLLAQSLYTFPQEISGLWAKMDQVEGLRLDFSGRE